MFEKIKQALKSKTVRFNLFIALFGLLEANLNLVKPLFSNGNYFSYFCVGVAAIGIILRTTTKVALSEK